MRFTQEVVTPEAAAEMLAKNYDQPRRIRIARANEHARAMAAGEWDEDSPEAIMVADDGTLLNGQHRLTAVIKYGKPIILTVCRGVNKGSYQHIDSGIPRELADRIVIDPDTEPWLQKICVGIIKQWAKFEDRTLRTVMSPQRAMDFFQEHREALIWLVSMYRKERGVGRLQAAVALCQFYERNPLKADSMARGYYLNTMQVPNAIIMREMMKGVVDHGGKTQTDFIGRCITLCKAELKGKQVKARAESIKPSRWED